jgi:hypothetical protein
MCFSVTILLHWYVSSIKILIESRFPKNRQLTLVLYIVVLGYVHHYAIRRVTMDVYTVTHWMQIQQEFSSIDQSKLDRVFFLLKYGQFELVGSRHATYMSLIVRHGMLWDWDRCSKNVAVNSHCVRNLTEPEIDCSSNMQHDCSSNMQQ